MDTFESKSASVHGVTPPSLDIAVLVAFEPQRENWVDPSVRSAFAPTQAALVRARDRVVELLGVPESGDVTFAHRSLTAIVLATSLERAGLLWRVFDPGPITLRQWRQRLEGLREARPRTIAISSTFVMSGSWLGSLCAMVRRLLPDAKIAVGGYYYATDAKQFLALDADILCVGEGERRIVQIAEAVRDDTGLEHVPGLYLRGAGKKLRHTGDAEPLKLDELPLPDWSLSLRIEPPLDPEREPVEYSVETQRGCVFKCEYCTFRTVAAPFTASVDFAVRALRNVSAYKGRIFLVDPTGTFPHDRFRRLLERLIEGGGSPLPIALYARVNDLDDEVCALMAKAGITSVAVGQESGDQRVLNAMRKGTRVDQVKPAVDALGRHGLHAIFFMMYGFPGESVESMAATRRLIRTINDGHEASPVVHMAPMSVIDLQDFAAVTQREGLKNGPRRYGYGDFAVSPARAAEDKLLSCLELARIPHAPASGFGSAGALWSLFDSHRTYTDPLAFFRWAKVLDRAMGIFAELEVEGKRPSGGELSRLRAELLASVSPKYLRLGRVARATAHVRHRLAWRALDHWAARGPETGLFTRAAIGWEVGRSTGRLEDAVAALRTGLYPPLGMIAPEGDAGTRDAPEARLIDLGIATGRRKLARSD